MDHAPIIVNITRLDAEFQLKRLTDPLAVILYFLQSSIFWTAVAAVATSLIAYFTWRAWQKWKEQQIFGDKISILRQAKSYEQKIGANLTFLIFAYSNTDKGSGVDKPFQAGIHENYNEIKIKIGELGKLFYINSFLLDPEAKIHLNHLNNDLYYEFNKLYDNKLKKLSSTSTIEEYREVEQEIIKFLQSLRRRLNKILKIE